MVVQQQQSTPVVRRYEYDDRTVLAADFGPGASVSVDVVDGTALVVRADGRQHDIDLPSGDVEAFNHNGVVTFEVRA